MPGRTSCFPRPYSHGQRLNEMVLCFSHHDADINLVYRFQNSKLARILLAYVFCFLVRVCLSCIFSWAKQILNSQKQFCFIYCIQLKKYFILLMGWNPQKILMCKRIFEVTSGQLPFHSNEFSKIISLYFSIYTSINLFEYLVHNF